MIRITGNTYPCRAQLRAMGGQFVERTRMWWVPDERADEARALVAAQPPRASRVDPPVRPEASPSSGRPPCDHPDGAHAWCDRCDRCWVK